MFRVNRTRSVWTRFPRLATAANDMNSLRKHSLAGGLFYLLTFVSIPTLALYRSVRAPGFVTGTGPDTPVMVGVLLEMIVALAGIGTAVALYPIVKRQGESRAVGFVASALSAFAAFLKYAFLFARGRSPDT